MSRLDDLVGLRNRVDEEIRAHVPKPLRRTAEQWLLMLPPDLNAAQHRADLEAEVGALDPRRLRGRPGGEDRG